MNWYYSVEGHATGPVSEEKLAEMARGGTVTRDTLIWQPSLSEWEPVWKLKPNLLNRPKTSAVARQPKNATEHVPAAVSEPPAPAPVPAKGIFSKLFGRKKK